MKTKLTIIIPLLLLTQLCWGQETCPKMKAEQEFTALKNEFDQSKSSYEIIHNKLDSLKNILNDYSSELVWKEFQETYNSAKLCNNELADLMTRYNNSVAYYLDKGCTRQEINQWFKKPEDIFLKIDEPVKQPEEETYLYFEPGKLIKEVDMENQKVSVPFIEELFSMKSETYLGDFIVPQEGQHIQLYESKCPNDRSSCDEKFKREKQKKQEVQDSPEEQKDNKIVRYKEKNDEFLKLKEVKFSIYEGALKDIKVLFYDENSDKLLLYENQYPVSLLRFSSIAPKTALTYKTSISTNKEEVVDETYQNTMIRFSDVVMYVANPGDNYVPDDLTLKFPDRKENKDTIVRYKVTQDTSLKNVLELRAYTDFLALFGDSNNGLIQLEGKADIFVNPFNFTNSRSYLFKKITPFVNFSRLDEENKYITAGKNSKGSHVIVGSAAFVSTDGTTEKFDIDKRLEILEKAYLEMGIKLNVFTYSFVKESPFRFNLYFPLRYAIANLSFGQYDESKNTETYQIKSFGMGGGLNLEFRKFNNFILTYNLEFSSFSFHNFNDIQNFENPRSFYVFTNEAEIAYYPGKQKNQSAFARFRAVNNSTKGNDDSFYQFQFGYRFTIPLNRIKQ